MRIPLSVCGLSRPHSLQRCGAWYSRTRVGPPAAPRWARRGCRGLTGGSARAKGGGGHREALTGHEALVLWWWWWGRLRGLEGCRLEVGEERAWAMRDQWGQRNRR